MLPVYPPSPESTGCGIHAGRSLVLDPVSFRDQAKSGWKTRIQVNLQDLESRNPFPGIFIHRDVRRANTREDRRVPALVQGYHQEKEPIVRHQLRGLGFKAR